MDSNSSLLSSLLVVIRSIDKLCAPCPELADHLPNILKEFYDASVTSSKKNIGPFSSLAIEGLDDESVWEVLQTRNKPLLRLCQQAITKLKKSEISNKEIESDDEDTNENEELPDDLSVNSESGSENIDNPVDGDYCYDGAEDEEEEENEDDSRFSDSEESISPNEKEDSDGNDLDAMERWLDREDELEMNRDEENDAPKRRKKSKKDNEVN
jgi:hypothetical protein